ncbi:aspartic peptidase domain-containing protein, partial [Trametes polyzona]
MYRRSDTESVVPISIDPSHTQYYLQVDTGSSDLSYSLTPHFACNSVGASKYDPSQSLPTDQYVSVTYAEGEASGPIVWDSVQIGGYSIDHQALIATTSVNAEPLSSRFAGVLGLALPLNSVIAQRIPPTTSDAPDGAALTSNLFGITPVSTAPGACFLSIAIERLGADKVSSTVGIGRHPTDVVPDPSKMHAADKLVRDTEERKNALEELVYDTRSRLDECYAPYVQPQEKEKIKAALQKAEDWLYTEAEQRTRVVSELRETLNNYLNQATSGDERFAHIEDKDKQAIVERRRPSERPKNVDPAFTVADVLKKKDEIIYFATPILTKPKPKPKVEPTGTGTPGDPGEYPDGTLLYLRYLPPRILPRTRTVPSLVANDIIIVPGSPPRSDDDQIGWGRRARLPVYNPYAPIFPRMGDLHALHELWCDWQDLAFVFYPTYAISETLWLHDVLLANGVYAPR